MKKTTETMKTTAFEELIDKLRGMAAEDPQWRDLLGRVGEELIAIATQAESDAQATAPPAEKDVSHQRVSQRSAKRTDAIVPAAEAVRQLTLGRKIVDSATTAVSGAGRSAPGLDLATIETRCRLKAEACDWAERRQQLIDGGADFRAEVQPLDNALIERASQTPDCFLWMCSPEAPPARGDGSYGLLARNFEVLAAAITHTRQVQESAAALELAINLLAEAQSAVRAAVLAVGRDREDSDQKGTHLWLKETTGQRQLFVSRYMRAEDFAEPSGWTDLQSRVEAASATAEANRKTSSRRRRLLDKVRHKASEIEKGKDVEFSWKVLVESVETLLGDGLPPSDLKLRDAVAGVIDEAPDSAAQSEGLRQVAREIDRAIASRPAAREAAPAAYNDAVATLRDRLAGRALVMIGGVRRPESEARLRDALGLGRLDWVATRSHESIDRFEPYVARPDVAIVVQMVLYSSHSVGEVSDFCRKHDKLFVRLTGGYNPNQFATRVLQQCSERLKDWPSDGATP